MIALLADPLVWVLLGLVTAPRALVRALTSKHATPLDAVLGRVFDRLTWTARKTPRKDHPCTTAASTASTRSTTRRTTFRAPKAATARAGTSRRPSTEWQVEPARGRHAMRLERGRDGLLHTGPMQAIPDGYGSLPDTPVDYWPSLYGPARQQRIAPDGETLRAARNLTGAL